MKAQEIREEIVALNNLIEKMKYLKTLMYVGGTSPNEMENIRKQIRKFIYIRDKQEDQLDKLDEVRLIMNPI